jgi:hypothetical protein
MPSWKRSLIEFTKITRGTFPPQRLLKSLRPHLQLEPSLVKDGQAHYASARRTSWRSNGRSPGTRPRSAARESRRGENGGELDARSLQRARGDSLGGARQRAIWRPGGQTTLEEATRLTPQLEGAYAKKSPAAFNDDLQRLYLMDLIDIPPLRHGIVRINAFRIFG